MSEPMVTRHTLLALQVCVPKEFTDEQAEEFANSARPTGIESKWQMRKQGNPDLSGCDERVQCEDGSRADCCHIMFDC